MLLQPLRDRTIEPAKVKGKPYQPIYVEVTAELEENAPDGFAADYDGVCRFTALLTVNNSSPAACKAPWPINKD